MTSYDLTFDASVFQQSLTNVYFKSILSRLHALHKKASQLVANVEGKSQKSHLVSYYLCVHNHKFTNVEVRSVSSA